MERLKQSVGASQWHTERPVGALSLRASLLTCASFPLLLQFQHLVSVALYSELLSLFFFPVVFGRICLHFLLDCWYPLLAVTPMKRASVSEMLALRW